MTTISHSKKIRGFTLIELMVTISILAIVLTVGVPSFRTTIENNQILTISDRLAAAVKLARSEAISRGKPITMCPSSNQSTCSGTWSDGWILFLDNDGNRSLDPGSDELLKAASIDAGSYTVSLASSTTTSFQFSGDGRASLNGTYGVCGPSARGADARGVVIQRSGGTRYASDADGNNIREDHTGTDLSC